MNPLRNAPVEELGSDLKSTGGAPIPDLGAFHKSPTGPSAIMTEI
ncbi:hypothetical protein [Palleronia sediminis]|nr:hypothetical protein [Palleronia sediminis]